MKLRLFCLLVLAVLVSLPAYSQRGEEHGGGQRPSNFPRANQGHVPPPPPRRDDRHAAPEPERHEGGRSNNLPHVNNDHWYGHDRPDDKRYHFEHPFEHGHFEHFGPTFRYRAERIDRDHHRFYFPGGFGFEVAAWDWPICADWCWDCEDDFVVYEDTDHAGWYLLYNVHTGHYVHVSYLGVG